MEIQYRSEHDSVGERAIPKDVYYGVQSLRAAENFHITGLTMHPELINSIAEIKKASAITNLEIGLLDKRVADAIVHACDEIVSGKLHDAFIVDPIQGGAGTSLNMNANEVIANRAIELLGGEKGDYSLVNPNDQQSSAASTNDVFPSAGKLAVLKLLNRAQVQLERLYQALMEKAEEFDDVLKMGRTQLQDAVPIRLGQEFRAYSQAVRRDISRFERAKDEMRCLNMGGTADSRALRPTSATCARIVPNLCKVTGLDLIQAHDLIDATQNLDEFVAVSGTVKTCAVNLSKMSNDLRLMSSGPRCGFGEINLPPRQNGSSIMPGKVNPVIPEVVNQGGLQHHGQRSDHHAGRRGRSAGAQRFRAHHLLEPDPRGGVPDLRGEYSGGPLRGGHHGQPGALPGYGGAQRGASSPPCAPTWAMRRPQRWPSGPLPRGPRCASSFWKRACWTRPLWTRFWTPTP